jgi:hypothetical protein
VVLSWNEKTGEREYKTVTNLWVRETSLLYQVKLPGQKPIVTTWNHPFWSVTQSAWIATENLKVGELLSLEDGSETSIESITHYETEETTVYNFEVEGNDSYYVGEVGVLVHNQSPSYVQPVLQVTIPSVAAACAAAPATLGISCAGAAVAAAAACTSIDCINKTKKTFQDQMDIFDVEYTEEEGKTSVKIKLGTKGSSIGVGFEIDKSKRGFDSITLSPEVETSGVNIGYTTDNNGKVNSVQGRIGNTEVTLDREGQMLFMYGKQGQMQLGVNVNTGEVNKVGAGIKGPQNLPGGDNLSLGASVTTTVTPIRLRNIFQNQTSEQPARVPTLPKPYGQCGINMTCLRSTDKSNLGCGVFMSCMNSGR